MSKSKTELSSRAQETSEEVETKELATPWGVLISQTDGFADIQLSRNSTGLGKMCDFVDFKTGERVTDYGNLKSVSFTDFD
jgi:hypothetical protein